MTNGEYDAYMAEVKMILEDNTLHDKLFLCRNGIPFDVAFSLDGVSLHAWSLHFSRMDGHEWDFAGRKWKEKPKG